MVDLNDDKPEGDFISKHMSYMIQAIEGKLSSKQHDEFNNLESDEERFNFLWKLQDLQSILFLEEEYEKKILEKAKEYREKGNAYFQKKLYLSALGEYNLCVLHAPTSVELSELKNSTDSENINPCVDNNELALGYANRSASLFNLKHFTECLIDIDLAIEHGYSKNILYKLFHRKGCCYLELNNKSLSALFFNKAKENLSLADMNEKSLISWFKTISKCLEQCEKLKDEGKRLEVKSNFYKVPNLVGNVHIVYPSASDVIDIQHNSILGRFFIAKKNIKVGDVLMIEKPFVSVLFSSFHKTHCYNCFKKVSIIIPCQTCTSIVYCSMDCKNKAHSSYHQYECKYFFLYNEKLCAKIGQLAVRLLMVNGLENSLSFLDESKQESEKTDLFKIGLNDNGMFSGNYNSVFNLNSNSNFRKSDNTFFDFVFISCFLIKLLRLSGYLDIDDNSSKIQKIGALLLKHLQIIQCNARGIKELQNPSKFDDPESKDIGLGLYPSIALINHSCDPCTDLNFFDNTAVIRAVRCIYEGEEINYSYGPLFYDVKYLTRQKQLKDVFYFNCKCVACWNKWPILEEMFDDVPGYRCCRCRSLLAGENKNEIKYIKCSVCKHTQNLEELVGELQSSYDVFACAMNDAQCGNIEDALPRFVQHLRLLQDHITHPWRDLAVTQTAVKQCYRFLANVKDI